MLQTEGSAQHSEARKKGMLILYNCHINTVISTTWLRAEFTAEVLYKQWSKKKRLYKSNTMSLLKYFTVNCLKHALPLSLQHTHNFLALSVENLFLILPNSFNILHQ